MKKLLVLAIALGLASSVAVAKGTKHHVKKHHRAVESMPMVDKTMPEKSYDYWFVGISTNYPVGVTEETGLEDVAELELHKADLGWGVLVGKRITKYFGAEANFQYFGKRVYNTETAAGSVPTLTYKDRYQLSVNGIGYLPAFNQYVDFFVKAGVGYQFNAQVYTGATDDEASEVGKLNTFLINFGGGVQFNINPVSIRLAYQAQRRSDFQVHTFGLPSEDYLTLDLLYNFC